MNQKRAVGQASAGKGLKQFSSIVHEDTYDKYFAFESVRSTNITNH
jgi:hypothetical protein